MISLSGKIVVVVGGSSGIGLAVVRAAADRGASVEMMSRSRQKLAESAKRLNGAVRGHAMDMLDGAAVREAFTSIRVVDHLVLTAVDEELRGSGRITELTDQQIEHSLHKIRGYTNVIRTAVPLLARRGTIALLSGAGALKAPVGSSLLSAANASIAAFGRALALELAPIRVNIVMPGPVDTPLHGDRRTTVKTWTESLPAEHFGQPEDIAEVILLLMTNPYITAQTLVVDGGYTAV